MLRTRQSVTSPLGFRFLTLELSLAFRSEEDDPDVVGGYVVGNVKKLRRGD